MANKKIARSRSSFGVPPGSVLGPNNYCMYTKPVGEIIKRYNIKYHCYADDIRVYMTLKLYDKWVDILSSIEAVLQTYVLRSTTTC